MTAYNENMAKKEMLFTVMEFMNQNTPRLVCEQKIASNDLYIQLYSNF